MDPLRQKLLRLSVTDDIDLNNPSVDIRAERKKKLIRLTMEVYDSFEIPPTLSTLRREFYGKYGFELPKTTIHTYLMSEDRKAFSRKKFPRLLKANRVNRVEWSSRILADPAIFRDLLFSDEKVFELEPMAHGSTVVYTVNALDPRRITPTAGRNTLRAMVWGCMSAHNGGTMCYVPMGGDGTTDTPTYFSVLRRIAAPFIAKAGGGLILLEDNASPHRCAQRYTVSFDRVASGFYPAHSPDLNPIERLWAFCQRRLQAMQDVCPVRDHAGFTARITQVFRSLVANPEVVRTIMDHTWANLEYTAANAGLQRPNGQPPAGTCPLFR